jgi:hypothetical protein
MSYSCCYLLGERELDSREGAIVVWEDGLQAFEEILGKACMERDAEHTQAKVVQQDYFAWTCAFTSNSRYSINFNQMLEECQILLSLQEMDVEVWEAMLAEEQECGLHSFDGQDVSTELEEIHVCVARVEDECAAEVRKLSKLVMEISNSLVGAGTLPIQDIPHLPKTAQEVLAATGLILEHLREEHATGASPRV